MEKEEEEEGELYALAFVAVSPSVGWLPIRMELDAHSSEQNDNNKWKRIAAARDYLRHQRHFFYFISFSPVVAYSIITQKKFRTKKEEASWLIVAN